MKTKSTGAAPCQINTSSPSFIPVLFVNNSFSAVEALQQYKSARENGEEADCPKNAFPSAGFEGLKITSSTTSAKGWPDDQNRYWWKLTLEDGSINEEFAFECDNPDKSDSSRYWFIIHGPNGLKIEGFSWEADYQKGFPQGHTYWRYVQYNECGAIKEWMEEKDRNYLQRLEYEKGSRVHSSSSASSSSSSSSSSSTADIFSFSRPFKLDLAKETLPPAELIPDNFRCPITREIMLEPVIATDGHSYERAAILQALKKNILSPITGLPMESKRVIPNHSMRSMICDFLTKHPECWQEVYVATAAVNALLALSSGDVSLDLQKWEGILRADPRLLTLSLDGVTLLERLCKQTESIVKTYLPSLLNLLTHQGWQDLIRIHSVQDWLKLVTQTCERCAASDLAVEFLNKLQAGLEIKEINPVEMALYALEQKQLGLFKLALTKLKDVNVPIDEDKNTLLHLAASQGQTEMVQCLANSGAHLKQRNAAGLKAEGLARLAGFKATADQIAIFKLTTVLESMGFFHRFEALEKEMQKMKASVPGPSGYAKKK